MHKLIYGPLPEPPAGDAFTFTPTMRMWWRPESLYFQLTTNATVDTRQVVASILDQNSNVVATVGAPASQAASLTYTYTISQTFNSQGYGSADPGAAVVMQLPSFWLPPDWSVAIAVDLIQTTDQISKIYQCFRICDEIDRRYQIEEIANLFGA